MKKALFFILLILLFAPGKVFSKTITIEVQGSAVSIPGEFGKQFFYLANGKNLWQIYSYRSNFPKIKKGDILLVRGEKSETRGIARIKTTEKNQIKILKNSNLPEDLKIKSKAVKENLGKITSLTGEIKKNEEGNFYFFDEEGQFALISPKSSNTFIKEAKNVVLVGVPILSGAKISFLLLSQKTEKGGEAIEKIEIAEDLLQPKKELALTKKLLIFITAFSLILLILKIIKNRKKL